MADNPQQNTPSGCRTPISIKFYAAFLGLTGEARKEFDILTEEDETLERAVSDCAAMWRDQMRQVYPDPVQCRQIFLARAIMIAAKGGAQNEYGRNVIAAFALFLCDRIEQRVRGLDFEDEKSIFRFRK